MHHVPELRDMLGLATNRQAGAAIVHLVTARYFLGRVAVAFHAAILRPGSDGLQLFFRSLKISLDFTPQTAYTMNISAEPLEVGARRAR